ncbi:hypothetical protein F5146DRAFT_144067 [Armillaria mellea]|nr:hypothetical protein F5146DRAFT_144067 [Armillaria mellea]
MLLRLLPLLLALLAFQFLEASAFPAPSHFRINPAGLISLEKALQDGAQQMDYVSAGSGPLETSSDKVLVEAHGNDLTVSQSSYDSQPWHNVEAVEGPGEGYL